MAKKEAGSISRKQNRKEQLKQKTNSTRITTVFIAAFLTVAIIAVAVAGVIAIINGNNDRERQRLENATFDSNIGEYIYISPDIYSDFDVDILFDAPDADDVENEISKLIYANRGDVDIRETFSTSASIKAGDEVQLYYRGYYIDGAEKVYFAEGTNLNGGYMTLGIGSGEFYSDFELALVGVIPEEYISLSEAEEVSADSIVSITYTNSSGEKKFEIIDLSVDNDVDYGTGFEDSLIGKKRNDEVSLNIGTEIIDSAVIEKIYVPVRVNSDSEELSQFSVKLTLPRDYENVSLRGKEVVFDTYFVNVRKFSAPIYNDAFVINRLKLTEKDLAEYEGENLAEKYKDKVFKELSQNGEPDSTAVEYEILKTLYKNRGDVKSDNGWRVTEAIKAGDTVRLYYRGFYLDDGGKKVYFDGGCNFDSGYTDLGIGEGAFVAGFEQGLVGKIPSEYISYYPKTDSSDKVGENDIVCISYSYAPFSGSAQSNVSAVIDMSDENLDEIWGKGFRELLLGSAYGEKINESHMRENVNEYGNIETDVFIGITVDSIFSANRLSEDGSELKILTVDVTFPNDYKSEELQNKDVTFEAYIVNVQRFEVPVFDDSFVAKTLKLKPEDLAGYEGDLAEKYRAKVMDELVADYDDAVLAATTERMWEILMENVEIKRLPTGNVQENYDAIVYEMESGYDYFNQYYSGMYSSLDQYAAEQMGVSSSAWRDEAMRQSEEAVTKQLLFYYIIKEANFIPTEEEYEALYKEDYEEQLDLYLTQAGCLPDKFDTLEEYENKKETLTKSFDSSYDEYYAEENVRYNYGIKKIQDNFANIIIK